MLKHPRTLPLTAVLALSIPVTALATNGYFSHGYGTKAKGMAGASGAALPQETMTAFTNPAGIVKLGGRADLGLAFFMPDRGYTANNDFVPDPNDPLGAAPITPGTVESDNSVFLIPHLGLSWMLDDKSALAVTLAGQGGMNTEYPTATFENFAFEPNTALVFGPGGQPVVGPGGLEFEPVASNDPRNLNPNGRFNASKPTGVDLIQMAIALTYSRQLTERHAVGITPIFAIQRFKAEGLQPFTQIGPDGQPLFSVSPQNVTNNGFDYSYGGGVRVGWLGTVADGLDLGVSYQTKLYMTDFDNYKGLFADGGGFDIPAVLNVGAAYKLTPKITLAFEYDRIFYSDVESLNNSNNEKPTLKPLEDNRLGANDGLGFGWEDINVYKFGAQYDYSDDWAFRLGYSHSDEPFKGAQALFNILAPATVTDHLTAGLTYRFGGGHEINLAYMHAFENEIEGQNQPNTGSQTGNVFMSQNEVEISWGYRF
ncbi:MAG: outer membrane protein transport protein [Gammaproteobacteria bacterium]